MKIFGLSENWFISTRIRAPQLHCYDKNWFVRRSKRLHSASSSVVTLLRKSIMVCQSIKPATHSGWAPYFFYKKILGLSENRNASPPIRASTLSLIDKKLSSRVSITEIRLRTLHFLQQKNLILTRIEPATFGFGVPFIRWGKKIHLTVNLIGLEKNSARLSKRHFSFWSISWIDMIKKWSVRESNRHLSD